MWQKVLFAWSHGAIDYVWYNLVATGNDPSNQEHGYGLFTTDFHPRCAASSFDLSARVGISLNAFSEAYLLRAGYKGPRWC